MKPVLLFVHGWGFDASIWDELRKYFAPEDVLAWDLGFFGMPSRPEPPSGRPVLAIGHSFGLLWLLHERLPCQAIVSINGFSCFAQRPDFPGIAPRPLARMRARVISDAAGTVTNFRALCGITTPLPAKPATGKLAEGLDALRNWDERPAPVTAALCGASDGLVSPAMSRACFPGAEIHWHEGGHMLPLTAPGWCAGHLHALSDRLA